jgi:hypothetical protein
MQESNSMKHTPGPWATRQTHKWPFNDGTWFVEVFKNGMQQKVICDGLPKSDARLIAASPDLLAALQQIMSEVAGCMKEDKYESARAAIALATGEAA